MPINIINQLLFCIQMEQERSQQNWLENMPAGSQLVDKDKFMKIPKDERQNYIKKMLAVEQLPGPPPFSFKKDYPTEGKFKHKDYNLHYYANEKTLHPKAVLFSFHGMGGHSGFGGYFANTLCEQVEGLNVYAFDQMNFGKSQGPFRGLVSSLDQSTQQAEQFVDFILSKLQAKPRIFICGASYGGSISIKMSINTPQKYAGLILLAPAVSPLYAAYGKIRYVGIALACILPPVRLFSEKEFKTGTRYNKKDELLSDKLIYNDGMIPHTATAVIKAMQQISAEFHKLTAPYILIQGGTDKFVDPFGALDLEEASPSRDKTTLYCQGMWHAIYAEREIEEVASVCTKWLRQRV